MSGGPTTREVKLGALSSRIWEKGDGETLLFLAGLGGLARWTPCLEALSVSRRVVVPALPGFPGGIGHDTLDTSHDWLTATLDLVDAAGAMGGDWVGVSIGASLALEAAAASQGARRLALVAPLGLFDAAEPVADLWAQPPGGQPALLCTRRESLTYVSPDEGDPIEDQILQLRASEAAARLLWPTTDTGLARRLHRIRAPLLLLRGREDRVLPASYLDRIAAAVAAETRVVEIEGAGHLADLDAPERCAEEILDFL